MDVKTIDTDLLVIGSGIAGLKAALEAAKRGKQTILVSKSPTGKANNTTLAGGGFACETETFSPETHLERTLKSGRMINDPDLVSCFVRSARAKVEELVDLGLNGNFHKAGFHCRTEMLIGGPQITSVLAKACRKAGVRFMDGVVITDLIVSSAVSDGICLGALGFRKRTADWYGFRAGAVILATGGAGSIYARNDNAPGITGDGYGLALKAGLELTDMEFVQFYPMVYAGSGHSSMILPIPFGDLGKIVNRHGEDIKEKYDLREKPIAVVSRDQLSQALFQEAAQGNGVDGALLLDLRQMDEARLPLSDDLKARYKKKIRYDSEPVKIMPACHHTMGGIPIDAGGRTKIQGLYAIGEVAGGIHGANRMGGNALSEALVFGELAAQAASESFASVRHSNDFEVLIKEAARGWAGSLTSDSPGPASGHQMIRQIMIRLKQTLWEDVGIIRNEASLRKGIREIEEVLTLLGTHVAQESKTLCRLIECRNAALSGMAIAVSALERKESRGAHYRTDYPSEDSGWVSHIYVSLIDEKPAVSHIAPIET